MKMKTSVLLLTSVLVGLLFPGAALAQTAAPSKTLTINISDSGFDQPSYTVATTPSGEAGIVTIVNRGSVTHTATEMPGAPFKVGIGQINFFAGQSTNITDFDTGGLGPGQNIVVGVPYPGTYYFTSATDCLNGNKSPRFNCTPAAINVVAAPTAAMVGSAVNATGNCARTVIADTPGQPAVCVGQDRLPGQTAGSPTQPVGNTTIGIDDVAGYQPSVVYLKVGSTITWTNNGQKSHGVSQKVGTAAPDGFHPLDAGALDPNRSYSYTFSCPPGPTSATTGLPLTGCTDLVGPFEYLSTVGTDAVFPNTDGFGTTISSPRANGSLYTGAIYLVP